MPFEVTEQILTHHSVMTEELKALFSSPKCWEAGLTELRQRLGSDDDGLKILAEYMRLAADLHEEYRKKGIDDEIYFATMAFCSRFVKEHRKLYGKYAFTWAWWFVRQLCMMEFRVGQLEFEWGEEKNHIHIPADADMTPQKIDETFSLFRDFLQKFYPERLDYPMYCESWMLSPAIKDMLSEKSNLLSFQRRFEIESVEESMAVLDWVFPGEKDLHRLSERTSLQRNMKKFLLGGGNVGWAKGKLKEY